MSRESSLDIIESCLNKIYTVRKKVLVNKSRRYEEEIQQKKNSPSKTSENLINQSMIRSNEVSRNKNDDNIDDEGDVGYEDERLIKELKESYQAFNPQGIKPTPEVTTTKGGGNNSSNSSNNNNIDEQKLKEIYEFRSELEGLISGSKGKNYDEQQIEETCNYLLDKYLTNKLDLAQPTPQVAMIKQSISNVIEEIASSGTLSSNAVLKFAKSTPKSNISLFNDTARNSSLTNIVRVSSGEQSSSDNEEEAKALKKKVKSGLSVKFSSENVSEEGKRNSTPDLDVPAVMVVPTSTRKQAAEKAKSTPGIAIPAEEMKSMNSSVPEEDPADRKSIEKSKIKQQYESYMNAKKKAQAEAQQIQQYENLTSDIKSVLESIQKNAS